MTTPNGHAVVNEIWCYADVVLDTTVIAVDVVTDATPIVIDVTGTLVPQVVEVIGGVPGPAGPAGADGEPGPPGPQGPPGTGGAGTDEVWVHTDEPTDPAIELWIDTDETALLVPRASTSITTGSLASGATESGSIALAAGYRLYQMTTDRPSRVRLYTTVAKLGADLSRTVGTDPPENSGCLYEYVALAPVVADLSPLVDGFDGKVTPDGLIPIAVTNLDSVARVVTVSFVYVRTE